MYAALLTRESRLESVDGLFSMQAIRRNTSLAWDTTDGWSLCGYATRARVSAPCRERLRWASKTTPGSITWGYTWPGAMALDRHPETSQAPHMPSVWYLRGCSRGVPGVEDGRANLARTTRIKLGGVTRSAQGFLACSFVPVEAVTASGV